MDSTSLLNPARVYVRAEVLAGECPVPTRAGIYASYFSHIPADVPTTDCVRWGALTLLYVGISPSRPPRNGKPPSRENLWTRIRYHYCGNAEGSTLRLTLGCLLAQELDLELRRVGSGARLTFGPGEARLSEWMGAHAFVFWALADEPWLAEKQLIGSLSPPLNLAGNDGHPFSAALSALRTAARNRARSLPILRSA